MDLERIGPPWKPGEMVTMAACHEPGPRLDVSCGQAGCGIGEGEGSHRNGSKLATATSRGHTFGCGFHGLTVSGRMVDSG